MKIRAVLGWCLAGLLMAGTVWAEQVAMVTDASGGVTVQVGPSKKKLALLAYLEPGMTIWLESNAQLSATFFAKPVEFRFTGPAKLTVERDRIITGDGKGETHTVSLQKTTAAKKFTVAQRESVTQAAFEMRAIGRPGLRLNDPVDTRLLGADALSFNWNGPAAPGGYQLSLYDSQNQLVYQAALQINSWTPAADLLKPGNAYTWEIKVVLGSEELRARGSFSVADAAAAQEMLAQKTLPNATYSERVLYAVFLESSGFGYDARRLWRELAKEHPDDLVARAHAIR